MNKFRFLLLDAGPIIKLFELGLWDNFVEKCDVTICRTVAQEGKWAHGEKQDICIDLETYGRAGQMSILDVDLSVIKTFYEKFDSLYKADLDPGEKETLAFLDSSSEPWLVCAADGAVFRTLGLLGKGEQGVSLEKVLAEIGLARALEWQYTERFRQKYTRLGQMDSIQDKGLR
ncbi:MAG: hypothetical protein A2Y77_16120 [Planctomycetes bacterium RBG_13_62_9]|nr:MAG: hypothetical protein A2Y77_16120 [Planctomycetes bacterium RBG_13_62_9]